ncbi:MAG: phosphodiester glycosidase family protein [Oscillospiraceae bacterium]
MTAIIPSYNPTQTLDTVVKALVKEGFARVIVVDDGSDKRCKGIFKKLKGIKNCTVLTHGANKGKGRGIKTALNWYIRHPSQSMGVVILDGEGRHAAKDAAACANAAEKSNGALVLGVRDPASPNFPIKSLWGKKIMSAILSLACGQPISDPQWSLWGIPNSWADTFAKLEGEGAEYEINMLLKAKLLNISIVEEPIKALETGIAKEDDVFPLGEILGVCKQIFYGKFEHLPRIKKCLSLKIPRFYRQLIFRICAVAATAVLGLTVLFFGAVTMVCYGPSQNARNLFVSTVMETSAAKFLARMYFDESEIETILTGDSQKAESAVTDTDAVTVAAQQPSGDFDGITVEDVKGQTFVGKLMTVSDPSRICLATLPAFDEYGEGKSLSDMIKQSDAVAGINAGGFIDPGGLGGGGMPMGVVIHAGQLLCNTETKYPTIIGFNKEYKLVAGNFSPQEALDMGIQEAVSFGPVLLTDGKIMPGGLNPRTAIGQRGDGAVLLLVVDGRQPNSLGATYTDVASLMLEHGAVNAANLDGGSSSLMIYRGETLNQYSMITGPRKLPTAFLVKKTEAI